MKKIIPIYFLLTFCILISAAHAQLSPLETLREYYKADQREDIESMMRLTDFSSVKALELSDFKADLRKTLETLALIFDTKSYEISNEKVLTGSRDTYVFYHLKNLIQDRRGETLSEDRDYVAVMHQSEGEWKIVYMQPKAVFEQNAALRELTMSAKNSIYEVIDLSGASNISDNGATKLGYVAILITLLLLAAIIFFLVKHRDLNLRRKILWVSVMVVIWIILLVITSLLWVK